MAVSAKRWRPLHRLGSPVAMACIALSAAKAQAQSADSLPAFKPDSAVQDPFRKAEAGPSPWSSASNAKPAAAGNQADSLARTDSVTAKIRKRHPAIALHLGVDFFDLDAKEVFNQAVSGLIASREADSLTRLKVLQGYDPVHLAFPVGLQALLPLGSYVDLVVKTHSYWYQQTTILGDVDSRPDRDEWYAVQANLGGAGFRYYIPPDLLSVTGGLGLFTQAVLFWNLGHTEIYTPYGSAPARFEPFGSGYEIQFGIQQPLSGPWQLAGAIGFLQQDFKSRRSWSDLVQFAAPTGNVHWASSAIQASLHLWYHFGAGAPESRADSASPEFPRKPSPPVAVPAK